MSLTRSIKRFVLLSLLAITGLTLFHRYVGQKSTTRSVSHATKQYVGFLRWATRRAEIFSSEIGSLR